MWKNYRLLWLSLLLVIVSSSAGNFSRVVKGSSLIPEYGGSFYYYDINTEQTNLVCPVTTVVPTVLQPSMVPRVNGSFFVEWLESAVEDWFDLVHVEEECEQEDPPGNAAAASESRCDKLFIIRSESPDQRGSFFVMYNSSGGAVITTEILYGPDGVSLISPLPPDGFPLLVNGDTRLKYELRIPSVDGQSSTLPILCERTQNGEFKHTSAFHVQPNSPTLGCLSSFSINNGYSTPYITLVTPGNLSLLFSDPTAIYLTYGSCNSTRTSLTSATLNITITADSTDLPTASTTQYSSTLMTTPSNSTTPITMSGAVSTGSTSPTAEPTTADDGAPTSAESGDISTTVTSVVVEAIEVTPATSHPGSTHIATSVNSNPFHLRNAALTVVASVLISVLLLVVLGVVIVIAWKNMKRRRRKTNVTDPDITIQDNPPVVLTGLNCGLDTDSGVVDGSANGGTPLSDCNFALTTEPGYSTPSTDNRESGLTDSSVSSELLKHVHNISKTVKETKLVMEDFRDNVYATQLGDTSSDQTQEESG